MVRTLLEQAQGHRLLPDRLGARDAHRLLRGLRFNAAATAGGFSPCLSEPIKPRRVNAGLASAGRKRAMRRLPLEAAGALSGSRDTRRDDNDAPSAKFVSPPTQRLTRCGLPRSFSSASPG